MLEQKLQKLEQNLTLALFVCFYLKLDVFVHKLNPTLVRARKYKHKLNHYNMGTSIEQLLVYSINKSQKVLRVCSIVLAWFLISFKNIKFPKAESTFHLSEADLVSTRKSGELTKLSPQNGSTILRQLNPNHKKDHKAVINLLMVIIAFH